MRFYIHDLNNSIVWSQCLSTFQALINNFTFVATEKAFNEVVYNFTSNTVINLLRTDIVDFLNFLKSRIEIRDAVSWTNMNYKRHYDRKYSSLFFKEDEWALLKLHQNYSISFFIKITKKLTQQFVDSFKILVKIERLTYRLNISDHWKVHSIFSIAQLKSTLSLDSDSFKRSRSDYSNSIFVERDIDIAKSYKLKRILNKRTIKRERKQSIEYLIKWKDYDSKFDKWMNIKNFQNAKELVEEYESIISISKVSWLADENVRFFNKKETVTISSSLSIFYHVFRRLLASFWAYLFMPTSTFLNIPQEGTLRPHIQYINRVYFILDR